jgi:hypothetical protein
VESKPAVMSVAKPVSITTQPVAPLRVGVAGSFTLSVGATGDGLNYQWSKDGVAIAVGGTSAVLSRSASQELAGAYQVKVWNAFSMALSNVVNVSVSQELGVKVIQPGTVDIGGSANLIANASGPGQLSYQWYKGESLIQGATGETLKISPVTKTDGGSYHVTVTSSEDPSKKEPSNRVVLGVRDVPRVLVAPVSRIVGGTTSKVSFTVVAESRAGGTLNFAWSNVGTGSVSSKGNTSTLTITANAGETLSQGAYSVTVSSAESVDGKVQAGSITLSAKLTVLSTAPKAPTTAGSDGVSVHTSWWVYWVKATRGGSSRNGYYALERSYINGVVTPKRAVWVWQPQDPTAIASTYPKDDWLEVDQSVLDAVASERGEFSVLASRIASGTVGTDNYVASGDYAIAGRVEEEGEGSLYGAPDFVEGVYSDSAGEYTVELSWDMEQVYRMDVYSDLPSVIEELQKALQDAMLDSD